MRFIRGYFPIQFGFPYRKKEYIAENPAQFVFLAMSRLGRRPVYVELYPIPLKRAGKIDAVFLDIDNDDLEKAYSDMRVVVKRIKDNYGQDPLVVFSGRKGFHVYAFFDPVKLADTSFVIRKYVRKMFGDIKSVDWHVVGDINRLVRLPYTPHHVTQRLCYPVDPSWSLDDILRRSKALDVPLEIEIKRVDAVRDALLSIQEGIAKKKPPLVTEAPYTVSGAKMLLMKKLARKRVSKAKPEFPPCVLAVLAKAEQGINLTHAERFLIATYFLHVDMDTGRNLPPDRRVEAIDKLMERVFKYQPDFNPEITRYQLEHIAGMRGGGTFYKVPSCERLRDWGICPFKCGRKHPLERWVRR